MPDGEIQKYPSVKMLYFNYICVLNQIRGREKARAEAGLNAIKPHNCSLLGRVVVLLNDDFKLSHFPDQGITGNSECTGRFDLIITILM